MNNSDVVNVLRNQAHDAIDAYAQALAAPTGESLPVQGVPEGWHKVGGAVMPKHGDYVLVLTTDADGDPIAITANYNGKTLFLGVGGHKVKPATHWTAIPAAPTGASK